MKSLSDEVNYHLNQLNIFYCYSVLSFSFLPPHEGSFTLYNSPWIILTLHLLIIWALTWVFVQSDNLFGFLWVVVAKTVVLFKGFLHINEARRVAVMHSMRWKQLSPRYFWISITLVCLWCTSLSLELLGRSPWLSWYIPELFPDYSRRCSSSNHLSLIF